MKMHDEPINERKNEPNTKVEARVTMMRWLKCDDGMRHFKRGELMK
jgi:hypothetical protein